MSYAGMGLSIPALALPRLMPAATPMLPAVSTAVQVDPAVVQNLASFILMLASSLGAGDSARAVLTIVGGSLKQLRPAANGKYDGAAVLNLIAQIPTTARTYVSNTLATGPAVLSGTSYGPYVAALQQLGISSLTALTTGIPNNSFASVGAAAPAAAKTSSPALIKPTALVKPAATIMLKTGPATVVASAPAPTPTTDVACTDGYYLDASGFCQPNDAPPGVTAPPDASQIATTDAQAAQAAAQQAVLAAQQTAAAQYTPVLPATALQLPMTATLVPVATSTSAAPLGVSWKWWALGAAGVVVAGVVFRATRKVTPNRRRRRKRS